MHQTLCVTAPAVLLDSPLGRLQLVAAPGGGALAAIRMDGNTPVERTQPPDVAAGVLADAAEQLHEYFAGSRRDFTIPLEPAGTPFQLEVWEALRRIPFGETVSYGELARRVGRPRSSRAVGSANRRNPLSIVVPCHRVIGADGTLTGYAGGLDRKEWLLNHEQRV